MTTVSGEVGIGSRFLIICAMVCHLLRLLLMVGKILQADL